MCVGCKTLGQCPARASISRTRGRGLSDAASGVLASVMWQLEQGPRAEALDEATVLTLPSHVSWARSLQSKLPFQHL